MKRDPLRLRLRRGWRFQRNVPSDNLFYSLHRKYSGTAIASLERSKRQPTSPSEVGRAEALTSVRSIVFVRGAQALRDKGSRSFTVENLSLSLIVT
jgi:hypothetical protein